jgi:hypothetical protein
MVDRYSVDWYSIGTSGMRRCKMDGEMCRARWGLCPKLSQIKQQQQQQQKQKQH